MGSVGAAKTKKNIDNLTVGEARKLSKNDLNNLGAGKLSSFGTRFNEDGTLAYATFNGTENVAKSDINLNSRYIDVPAQFRQWASSQEPNTRYTSIDVDKNGNITAWKSNGDKDFFEITGGTRSVKTYIEPNTRFGRKLTDKVYVNRTPDYYVDLKFKYKGSKKY